jgi:hypothetical protein
MHSNIMRTLSMRIVTRRILRHHVTITNSNILVNFLIKLKSLEIFFYDLIMFDLCKETAVENLTLGTFKESQMVLIDGLSMPSRDYRCC